jgi:hypothetical protein
VKVNVNVKASVNACHSTAKKRLITYLGTVDGIAALI